ncbi:MAG: hypothetical protein IMW89_15950 [Ktedonobacteraceae bacterium]|nr:hypothetical protein [Ktedonobacteraceae bacterium]
MAVEEKRENTRAQRGRLSSFAQERHRLSTSVEETLSAQQEQQWQDEDEQEEIKGSAQREALIPPRLSLQSKPMPAVRPAGTTAELERVSTESRSQPQPQPSPKEADKQHTGILARFAQRLTSSLAALGGTTAQLEALPPQPPEQSRARQRQDVSPLSQPPQIGSKTASGGQQSHSQDHLVVPSAGQIPPASSISSETAASSTGVMKQVTPLPATPFTGKAAQQTHRPSESSSELPRLAGRTTKIRLETAPVAAVRPPLSPDIQKASERQQQITDTGSIAAVRIPQTETSATSSQAGSDMLAVDTASEGLKTQEEAASAVIPDRPAIVTRSSLAGSGVFECGQRDVTIENASVTASSVVLVTLTANAGPVVVQYVSLRPHAGFTVHLTAPATARAPFNYIVL